MSDQASPRRPSPAIGRFRRLPRWLRALLSACALALGVYLITRPTSSLTALALFVGAGFVLQGVLTLASDEEDGSAADRWWQRGRIAEGLAWIAAGVFVLLFLGLTVRLLAVVIGLALVAGGLRQLAAALRRGRTADRRIASAAFGVASIGFGLLALLWPDITLLVAAVVFGARLILSGVAEGWRALHGARTRRARPASGLRRFARTATALATVVLVAIAGAVSVGVRAGTPVVDEFYAAPRDLPDEPGALIRAEPFARGVPENATGWRILYSTTRADGSATVASGIVVVPDEGDGEWPVIDWNHGTTGFARSCAPSLLAQPFESGALFLLPRIVDSGWALVATDYTGLGTEGPHPYLIGEDAARASLDATRAARQLEAARLGDDTVVWGHSQGGGAALWTGALADDYAPELDIEGVAALAPAANLPGLVGNLPSVTGGSIFASFVVAAYTARYQDVTWREYIRPGAEQTVRAMSQRCLSGPAALVSVLDALSLSRDPAIFAEEPTSGAFGERLEQNVPPATVSAPLLIAQGEADGLVVPSAQQAYVDGIRAQGQQVDYRVYPGLDHVPLVQADSPLIPELFSWTSDRFAGEPVR